MILFAIFLWTLCFYFILDRNTAIKTELLKIIISFLWSNTITAFAFFGSLVAAIPFELFQVVHGLLPLLGLGAYYFFVSRQQVSKVLSKPVFSNLQLLLIGGCFLSFSLFFFAFVLRWGRWDAWAIWSLHAKFLASDGYFLNLFTHDIKWTHPDYPLMLPSMIALFWKSFYNLSPIVPMLVAFVTSILFLPLILSLFMEKGEIKKGLACLIALSATNLLAETGSSQYADTLLALFFFIPVVLHQQLPKEGNALLAALIGFFAASSGWIKNEGLAFFAIFSLVFLLYNFRNFKTLFFYGLGTLLPLIVIGLFKLYLAPPSYLVTVESAPFHEKFLDWNRHYLIFSYLGFFLIKGTPVLLIVLLISLIKNQLTKTFAFQISMGLMLAYYLVYISTPLDLEWQIKYSLGRLIHHVMPILMYTSFSLFTFSFLQSKPSTTN